MYKIGKKSMSVSLCNTVSKNKVIFTFLITFSLTFIDILNAEPAVNMKTYISQRKKKKKRQWMQVIQNFYFANILGTRIRHNTFHFYSINISLIITPYLSDKNGSIKRKRKCLIFWHLYHLTMHLPFSLLDTIYNIF